MRFYQEVICPEQVAFAKDDGPFGHISQFPDISREIVFKERIKNLPGDMEFWFIKFRCIDINKMDQQWFDIFGPFPERRDINMQGVSPVKQIEPEFFFLHPFINIMICG